jgi:hypothetical protein
MDEEARHGLIAKAQAEALKAKDEESRRVAEQAKRLDHITRALRIEGQLARVAAHIYMYARRRLCVRVYVCMCACVCSYTLRRMHNGVR